MSEFITFISKSRFDGLALELSEKCLINRLQGIAVI